MEEADTTSEMLRVSSLRYFRYNYKHTPSSESFEDEQQS